MKTHNPFQYGSIREPEYFVGRHKEIKQIVSALTSDAAPRSISVVGERRIGKTSLLNYLSTQSTRLDLDPDRYVRLFLSFEGYGRILPTDFWRLLLEQMRHSVATYPRLLRETDLMDQLDVIVSRSSIPFSDIQEFFRRVDRHRFCAICILDEFDIAASNPNFDFDFFGALRNLAQHHNVAYVVASRSRLIDLCRSEIKSSPFFNVFEDIYLSQFCPEEALELLSSYLARTDVIFKDQDIAVILDLAGHHPFFFQLACYLMFDACTGAKGQGEPGKYQAIAKQQFRERATPHFEYYWEHSTEQEKVVLTALSIQEQKLERRKPISYASLSKLYREPASLLDGLRRRGLVMQFDDGYMLFSSALSYWIAGEVTRTTVMSEQEFEDWIGEYKTPAANRAWQLARDTVVGVNPKYWRMLINWLSDPQDQAQVGDLFREASPLEKTNPTRRLVMKLTGRQYEELTQALIDAFPTLNKLAEMVRFRLDKNIHAIALGDNLAEVIFRLIGSAEAEGWTLQLVTAATASNPGNPRLFAFSQQIGLAPHSPDNASLERTIRESNGFLDVEQWHSRLGELVNQVCRVEISLSDGKHRTLGTGFLVGPDLAITNYHVMEPVIEREARKASNLLWASPGDVILRFDYKRSTDGKAVNPGSEYRLAHDWLLDCSPMSQLDNIPEPKAESPQPDELDYALLRVDGMPGNAPVGSKSEPGATKRGWIKVTGKAWSFKPGTPLLILQHPEGDPLKLAFDTDAIISLNANRTRVLYHTNTEPGSSGSPCFDINWDLVALHHVGDPNFAPDHVPQYNQGIPFTAILDLLTKRDLDKMLMA